MIIKYYTHQRLGRGLKHQLNEIDLPRQHAVMFAAFCYSGGCPEGMFSLHMDSLKMLTKAEQQYVIEPVPGEDYGIPMPPSSK